MWTRIGIVVGGVVLAGAVAGCETVPFAYVPSSIPTEKVGQGITLQIDQVHNNQGLDDPKKVRFNVELDRPVSEAVREALALELQQAGFRIGPSDLLLSVTIEGAIHDGSYWTFSIRKASDQTLLFSRKYPVQPVHADIFDHAALMNIFRTAITQFTADPSALLVLAPARTDTRVARSNKQEESLATARSSDVDAPSALGVKVKSNAYAVVIGIESYRNKLPKADFASHDAQVMGDYLTKVMGYEEENVAVLLNDRAAKTDLEKYIEHWLPKRVEPGASVFIYFSGHGAPNPKTGDAYLVPYDGDPAFVDATGYPLKRLYEQAGKLQAKEVIVMLDSCFSGAGGRSVIAKGMRPMVLSVENPVLAGGKTVVLAASQGDQVSSTYDQKSHGLLTYYFLKGLQGEADKNKDGTINLAEVFDYVKPQVERKARRDFNNEQTPQLLGSPDLLAKGVRLVERATP